MLFVEVMVGFSIGWVYLLTGSNLVLCVVGSGGGGFFNRLGLSFDRK